MKRIKRVQWFVGRGPMVMGIGVCAMLVSAGCSTMPESTSQAPGSPANPSFLITLHCAPEDELPEPMAAETWTVAQVGAESVGPADEAQGEDYECFSLLEAMQLGAESLASQARFERTFAH